MTPLSLSGLWGAQSPTGGATTAQTHTVHHIWYPENIELRGQWGQRLYTRSNDSKPTKSRFTLSKTPNLWWWYASFQNECLNTKDSLLFILTYNHLAEGDVIFKINVQGGGSYNQTVNKHPLPSKTCTYLSTHNWFPVISRAKCHSDKWVFQHGWYETLTELW